MKNDNLAIIRWSPYHSRYELFNQDGRMSAHRQTYRELEMVAEGRGYTLVEIGTKGYHDLIDLLNNLSVVH